MGCHFLLQRIFPTQVSGKCVISLALSHHSKNLKWRTDPVFSFIWQTQENTSSKHEGRLTQKAQRETPAQFWLLFLCAFLLPLSLPFVNWGSQEGCLFYLRFLPQSSDLPLFYFCGLFPSLFFYPPPFWTPFSYSNYLTQRSNWHLSYLLHWQADSLPLCHLRSPKPCNKILLITKIGHPPSLIDKKAQDH